jgi:uncharacterized protein DUF3108
MKKILILLVLMGSSGNLFAQCKEMFDFQEGTSWQWTNYNKKGKYLGKSMQKVDKYKTLNNGFEVTLTVVSSDKKGEQMPPVSMDMSCKDGVVYFDMKKFIPDEYFKEGDVDLQVSGENLEMPTNMEVGDYLRDASVKMALTSGGSTMGLNMAVDIYDRKVAGEETLKTPAGEFNCLIITQSIKTKDIVTVQMDTKEWYAQGVGMVKSESYRKGKLVGYSILTEFSQ